MMMMIDDDSDHDSDVILRLFIPLKTETHLTSEIIQHRVNCDKF